MKLMLTQIKERKAETCVYMLISVLTLFTHAV